MQKILLFVILVVVSWQSFAQNSYKVLFVKGNITANGKPVAVGNTIAANATLTFKSAEDLMRVKVEPGINRFDIKGSDSQTSGFKKLVSELIAIAGRRQASAKASTRGTVNSVESLKKFVAANSAGKPQEIKIEGENVSIIPPMPFLIIGSTTCKIEIKEMDLNNDDKLLFVGYKYSGKLQLQANERTEVEDNKVSYKITQTAKSFVLGTEMLRIGNQVVKPEEASDFCLYYSNGSAIKPINTFIPVFVEPNNAELLQAIKEEVSFAEQEHPQDKQAQFDKIIAFLITYYGTPDSDNVKQWLKEKLNKNFD